MSALVFSALLACSSPETPSPEPAEPAEPAPLQIRATCPSAAWLTRAVGGPRVEVVNLLPPGEDPATWRPEPDQIAALAEADLIVANGAGLEPWIQTATLPELVLTASGLSDLITLDLPPHSHGPGGLHSHKGTDPHTWLDPLNFSEQARVLRDALVRLDPGHTAIYDARLGALQGDLQALDADYTQALTPLQGRPMAANHPSYSYLARRYGLDITPFAFDPSAPPDPEELQAFTAWAAGAGENPVLLWEQRPAEPATAAFPPAVRHVYIDPLEQPSGNGYDYLRQAEANVKRFLEI